MAITLNSLLEPHGGEFPLVPANIRFAGFVLLRRKDSAEYADTDEENRFERIVDETCADVYEVLGESVPFLFGSYQEAVEAAEKAYLDSDHRWDQELQVARYEFFNSIRPIALPPVPRTVVTTDARVGHPVMKSPPLAGKTVTSVIADDDSLDAALDSVDLNEDLEN